MFSKFMPLERKLLGLYDTEITSITLPEEMFDLIDPVIVMLFFLFSAYPYFGRSQIQ